MNPNSIAESCGGSVAVQAVLYDQAMIRDLVKNKLQSVVLNGRILWKDMQVQVLSDFPTFNSNYRH